MWYLFKDYVETPSHIEFMIFGVSTIASYIVASVSCKSRHMLGYEVRVFATAAGLMVAALVGGIKFTFVSTLLISMLFTWLMVIRGHALGW
ncbi:hypothetical protein QNE95_002392 [Vibrio vulnificus]|uniref:hypothetical protein n=1 Tax=Vibrio vulnificus TaxID=672 RepID=UPI0005765E87|nr:hypothetical protein [Vibrio vulnificus]EGQ7695076.1 hypothetical protein [Vibrio vulnificus]EGQ7952097.1 hypothetical protein [Vibrio vulnificus]EGQ8072454.1 hypothetical protein [Vibrio vulnificus]EGS1996427.1 hypothetical protein [Vibrio vulnificus]EHK8976044.1 hypothetical protein [Vibrio vulnificus]